ncbi:MAG: hypothetical protein Q4Q07_07255 [Tissierellia bacterium]|nr:hypothetical protein [Tissierellia bacterium]
MNKKLQRNIQRQNKLEIKIEEMQTELEILKEEQIEMENMEVIKAYRSREISLDEFLEIVRQDKPKKIEDENLSSI